MISSQSLSRYRRKDTASESGQRKQNGKCTPCTGTGAAEDNPYDLKKQTTVSPRRRMEDNTKMGLESGGTVERKLYSTCSG
jgi:hypothetical protein